MGTIDFIILGIYMIAMIVIGIIASGKIDTMDDFMLGGKRFGIIALSGTIVATMIGSGMTIGAVGNAYSKGASGTVVWMYAGFALGLFFFAALTDRIRNTGARSMGELISMKFGPVSRQIASFVILAYAVSIVAINIAGFRTVLLGIFSDFNVSTTLMTVIATAIAILYTSIGGYYAVVWTDVVQLGLMLVGLIIIGPIVGFSQAGGVAAVSTALAADNLPMFNPFTNGITATSIGFFLAYFLTVPGDPTMPQRALSAKDNKTAKTSYIIAGVVAVLMGLSLLVIGESTRVIMPGLENPESALIQLILSHYPIIIKGIVISAIIAAIMSSFDSFLILASTHLIYDVVGAKDRKLTDDRIKRIMSITTVVIGVLGLIIALFISSLFQYLYMVFSVVGSALVPVLLAALFSPKKISPMAANLSMIVGTLVPAFLYLTKGYDVFLGDPIFLGIISSTITLIVASLIFKRQPDAENQA